MYYICWVSEKKNNEFQIKLNIMPINFILLYPITDNIKMDLREVGCGSMDWIEPAQDRDRWRDLLNAEVSLRVP